MEIKQEDSGDILFARPSFRTLFLIDVNEKDVGAARILLDATEAKQLSAALQEFFEALKGGE